MGSWVISAVVRFGTMGLNSIRGASTEMGRLNAQMDSHSTKIARMTQQLEGYRTKMLQVGQAVSGGLALAGLGVTIYGVEGAAQLQRALTSVGIATNRNDPASMQRYAAMAFAESGKYAQDATTIAREMAMAAMSGLNDPNKLAFAFDRIAKAADVMWIAKGTDPVDSVRQLSTMSHLFAEYSGRPFEHMLDRALQMQFVQPEGLQQLITQGRIFIPIARTSGVSDDQIFRQAMTMGQTGFLRSRGGSGLARMIEYIDAMAPGGGSLNYAKIAKATGLSAEDVAANNSIAMTGHLSKLQVGAFKALHLLDSSGFLKSEFLTKKGGLNFDKIVDSLEKMAIVANQTHQAGFAAELVKAFLAQGGRYAADILQPGVYQKAQENWRQMQVIGTVDTMWKRYSDNFLYQWGVFWTNLGNVPKAIFYPILPQLKDMFKSWGEELGKIVMFMSQHPDVARRLAKGIIEFTIAMGLAFVAFTIKLSWSAIQMPIAMFKLEAAIDGLTATATTDATIIAGAGTKAAGAATGFRALAGSLYSLTLRLAPFLSLLALKGDSGNLPAQPGSPAWINNPRAESDRYQRRQAKALQDALNASERRHSQRRPMSDRVHVGTLNVHLHGAHGVSASDQLNDLLNNPLSPLRRSGSIRTGANIPRVSSTRPR